MSEKLVFKNDKGEWTVYYGGAHRPAAADEIPAAKDELAAGREEMRKAVLEVLTTSLKNLDEQYEPTLQYFETVLEHAIADVKEIK